MEWKPDIQITTEDKHRTFLYLAYNAANTLSDDIVTKVGAVIVESTPNGYKVISEHANHIRSEVYNALEDKSKKNIALLLSDRDWKLKSIIHAEPSAINFARDVLHKDVRGATMYMPWVPCIECAETMYEAGIVELISHKQLVLKTPERWWESTGKAIQYLKDKGIKHLMYDGYIGGVTSTFSGEIWHP